MKKIRGIWLLSFVTMGVVAMLLSTCKKDEEEDEVELPLLTTSGVYRITDNTASCGGEIASVGGSAITEKGVCWSTTSMPGITGNRTSDGADSGSFVSSITGLEANTKYYVRAYATNNDGTNYGNEQSFTTPPNVTDIDGNTYHTVRIGNQVWMAENLRVSHYRNGDPVPEISDGWEWGIALSGACCEGSSTWAGTCGKLYNFYAAIDSRHLAPAGWHIPADADWKILEGTVDSQYPVGDPEWDKTLSRGSDAGGKLKSTDSKWQVPNWGATDESGFSALPGGYRHWDSGQYLGNGYGAIFVTSTPFDETSSYCRAVFNDDAKITRTVESKQGGGSVRCIKD